MILGILKIGGVFAKSPAPPLALEHIYGFDLLGKADRSRAFSIDAAEFERQDWSRAGLGPTDGA